MLPDDPQQVSSITDYLTWRKALERTLHRFNARLTGLGAKDVGTIQVWAGDPSGLPAGLLLADGSTVGVADYPVLYAVIGDMYSDGTEGDGEFRLPSVASPAVGVSVIRG